MTRFRVKHSYGIDTYRDRKWKVGEHGELRILHLDQRTTDVMYQAGCWHILWANIDDV